MIGEVLLLVWILTGPAAPTTPVVLDRYLSQADCDEAGKVWRKTPTPDTRVILYDAACIPAGITQTATVAPAPVAEPKKEPEPPQKQAKWRLPWSVDSK